VSICGSLRFVSCLAAAALLPLAAPAAESPSVLLQKAIYAEETEGNLDSAIKLYEQIAAEAATNRTVVAQAQYRLAVCYQKKGNKDLAIKLLNEVVQRSPANEGTIKKVRELLTALGARSFSGVAIRRVLLPTSIGWVANVSPNGRYIVYRTAESNDLIACEFATGKIWTLAKRADDDEVWGDVVISPDSQWVVHDSRATMLTLTKIDGSERKRLYDSGGKEDEIFALYWSPDGKQLIAERSPKGEPTKIVAIDVQTGAWKDAGLPASTAMDRFFGVSWNTQYWGLGSKNYPKQISIWDSKTGRSEMVIDHGGGKVIGWAPGDSRLLFERSRGLVVDLLAVAVEDGKPRGEPEVVWSDWGNVHAYGPTEDGVIYYSPVPPRPDDVRELWVMEGFLATKPRIPPAESWRITTEIPTGEMILGSDNSILDRKFGLGAMLPNGWTVSSAVRQGNGGSVVQITSSELREANARPRIIYWPTKPWANPGSPANDFAASGAKPTTPQEVDGWLRKRVSDNIEAYSKMAGHMTKVEGQASSVINEHRALTITGSYTRNGKSWSEVITTIYSDNVIVHFDLQAPTEKLAAIRPSFERLVESISLP
jgi:WD40 repeat protein